MPYRLTRRLILLHILRFFVLGLLFAGYYLYLKDLVSMPFWVGSFLLGTVIAFLLTPRLRFLPAAGVFVFILILIRAAVFLVLAGSAEASDPLFLLFDMNFLPLLLPLGLNWLFTYLTLRHPGLIRWEFIVNAWLLFLLFFSQARYELDLLPHPVYMAAGTALFLLLEILILIISSRGSGKERGVGRRSIFLYILILLLIIGAGFILFLGRYSKGAVSQGGGLVKPTLFRFDFSRFIKLESEITMSSDLILLFREEEPSYQPLLRRFVLSGYRPEAGFFISEPPGASSKGGIPWEPDIRTIPEERIALADPGWKGRTDSVQEYFLVNFDPTSLVAMNYPVELIPLSNWDTSSFIRNYKAVSRISGFLTWELADTEFEDLNDEESGDGSSGDKALNVPPEMPVEIFRYYTDYGEDEKVRALALEVTRGLLNSYDRIMAIQSYLKENYFYSLKPGVALDGNQLHHFLFTAQKGYCSYFAFSMALLCRSLGIPARVAVGFFIDPELGVMNIYPVRSDMAHAWVEVFFPGYGWINFDPTSQNLAPGEDFQFGGLEVDRFLSLVEEILINRDGLGEEPVPEEEPTLEHSDWRAGLKSGVMILVQRWYLILPLLYLLIFIIRIGFVRLQILFSKDAGIKMEGELLILKRGFYLIGFGFGSGLEPEESLLEWAERVSVGVFSLIPFMELYLKNRYAPGFSLVEYELAREYRRRESRKVIKYRDWKGVFRFLILPFRRFR